MSADEYSYLCGRQASLSIGSEAVLGQLNGTWGAKIWAQIVLMNVGLMAQHLHGGVPLPHAYCIVT